MTELIIDQEFKMFLPALDPITYAWLEENILEHGCMQPPLPFWGAWAAFGAAKGCCNIATALILKALV